MSLPVLVELVRSGVVESTHAGSVVALRPDGSTALSLGVVDRPVFPRSSNKPLQAVGLLDAGWSPPDDQTLALATASHSGLPAHLEVVRRMLSAAGLTEEALGCPALLPLDVDAAHALLRAGGEATRLTMNCSGKHAAMLATCVANGWPTVGYLAPDHPVQRAMTATIERLAGEPVRHVAVDGCGAPQHALTLIGLARAFTALVTGDGTSRRTADAMRAHPELVGGPGREVTRLMAGTPGLVAKDGAEGVFAAALPDGAAAAVKVADGSTRAAVPMLVGALRALGVTADVLDELATEPVLGGGVPVGELRGTSLLG
ncbi:MAG: asparaginase [Frankiaceae bacterium]|nr:asparaginase [Frankiaceae bacterium]